MFLHSFDSVRLTSFVHFPSEMLVFGRTDDTVADTDGTADADVYLPLRNALEGIAVVTMPLCQYIGRSAFAMCENLREVHCPELVFIHTRGFMLCKRLKVLDMPKLVTIRRLAFGYGAMEDVTLPACRKLGSSAFIGCRQLRRLDLPECLEVGKTAIPKLDPLVEVNAPKCTVSYE